MDSSKEELQGKENKEAEVVLNSENQDSEMIDADKKHDYKKAKKLKKSIKCMVCCSEKVQMYQKAAEKFAELPGYEDADRLAERCRELAENTRIKVINLTYKKAMKMKNAAKQSEDFKQAAMEFRKVKGFEDADQLSAECIKIHEKLESRKSIKSALRTAAIILFIIAFVLGARTSHAKYYLANTYMFTGSYVQAAKQYSKLGTYKDCKERLTICRYKAGLNYEKHGNYLEAKKCYAKAGYYKDSDIRKVNMEIKLFPNRKAGGKIIIGNSVWKIMEIRNGQALLLKNKPITGIPYNNASVKTTWETSTVRKWLNTEYRDKTFTKEEIKRIALTDLQNSKNVLYGTDGGNATQDYLFLLSTGDAKKYKALLPNLKSYSWLRSPGSSENSAVFLSKDKKVMLYGYDVSSDGFTMFPAFWFKFN